MPHHFALRSLLSLGMKITDYGQLSEKVLTLVKVRCASAAFVFGCLGGRRVARGVQGGFTEQSGKD